MYRQCVEVLARLAALSSGTFRADLQQTAQPAAPVFRLWQELFELGVAPPFPLRGATPIGWGELGEL